MAVDGDEAGPNEAEGEAAPEGDVSWASAKTPRLPSAATRVSLGREIRRNWRRVRLRPWRRAESQLQDADASRDEGSRPTAARGSAGGAPKNAGHGRRKGARGKRERGRAAVRWVHLDPCEAAVDEPLIYSGWGKQHTYIVAIGDGRIVDVTQTYTADWNATLQRRQLSPQQVQRAMRWVGVTHALR